MFKKENILSLIGGLSGVFFLLFGLMAMNGFESMKNKRDGKKSTTFNIAKITKKKKKKLVQKSHPRPKKKNRPKVATPKLAGTLNGTSFGLDQFEFLGEVGDGLLGNSSNVIMTEDTVDEVPKVRYRASIDYPHFARSRSIEGHVVLNMLVGTKGEVEEVKLLNSGPEGIFEQVAMSSARLWQFEAASYQGKKVKVWVRQRISFNLK